MTPDFVMKAIFVDWIFQQTHEKYPSKQQQQKKKKERKPKTSFRIV